MTDIVQALAALDAEPNNPNLLAEVVAQAKDATAGDKDAVARARKAVDDSLRRLRERGDYDAAVSLIDGLLSSGLPDGGAARADLLCDKGRILADDLLRDKDAE